MRIEAGANESEGVEWHWVIEEADQGTEPKLSCFQLPTRFQLYKSNSIVCLTLVDACSDENICIENDPLNSKWIGHGLDSFLWDGVICGQLTSSEFMLFWNYCWMRSLKQLYWLWNFGSLGWNTFLLLVSCGYGTVIWWVSYEWCWGYNYFKCCLYPVA